MSVVDPEKDTRIAEHVASHAGSDYQEYLLDYDDQFVNYRVNSFCHSTDGIIFGLVTDAEVSALAKLVHLDWDTHCFGFEVAKIANFFGNQTESKATLLEEVKAYARAEGVKLLTCRVAYDDFSSLHALEEVGFRIVDAMNIFLWDSQWSTPGGQRNSVTPDGVMVSPLEKGDWNTHQAVREIAMSAFRHSRLDNDPRFSIVQVRTFYERLLNSFLEKQESLILVARIDDTAAGFILGAEDIELSEHLAYSLGYLWLVAVDEAFAGRGVGQTLFDVFMQRFSRQVRFIEVGTQINNYPALNLYARNGLKLVSSLVTMHLWL